MDEVISELRKAKALLLLQREEIGNTDEINHAINHVNTAIRWKEEDILKRNEIQPVT